jgi:hypothetical protein
MPDTRTILPDTEMLRLLYMCASGQSITLAARTTSAEKVRAHKVNTARWSLRGDNSRHTVPDRGYAIRPGPGTSLHQTERREAYLV